MSAPGQPCPHCATIGSIAVATKKALADVSALAASLGEASHTTGRQAWASPDRTKSLSERELQVVERMAEGWPNADIAKDLFITPETVKTHARRLFRKLGARDRAHAVNIAWQLGCFGAQRRDEVA